MLNFKVVLKTIAGHYNMIWNKWLGVFRQCFFVNSKQLRLIE